jgi:hypothetical protein
MKDEQYIGLAIPNNVIIQNPIADTFVVDVYDIYGKKLMEGGYAGKFIPWPGTDFYKT